MKKTKKFLIGAGIALTGIAVYSYLKDKLKEIQCDAVSEKLKKECEECKECEKFDDASEAPESPENPDTI